MRSDIFLRLPPPTALVLLFSIIDLTSAHAGYKLPRRTAAAAADTHPDQYRALDISPYPPLPTSAPLHPSDLRQRQDLNTVCGYIGGDPNLPATCSAGSHCVLEAAHGVIGCCPDGQDPCTTGIFTACVDGNNPAQGGAADPYAFTCGGGDVCYRNKFEGGFFQFGCGSDSSLAATVFASASGISATIDRPSLTISFSETPSAKTVSDSSSSSSSDSSTASSSTRSTTRSTTSSTRSTSTHSSSSSSESKTSTAPTHTTAPTEKSTAAPPATGNTNRAPDRTGAIVGGTISGVAVLIALIAAGIFLWRRRNRRRGNLRQGPGPGPKDVMTEYISPQMGGGGGGGGAAAFQPLHQSYEAWETGLAPGAAVAYPAQAAPASYPGSHGGAYAGGGAQTVGGRGGDGDRLHSDMVPLTREIDDFSRGFHDALGRIDEEDHTISAATEVTNGSGLNGAGMAGTASEGDMPANGENGRPLWQQNRRLSRNMMWM